ncbi:HD domain-containing protein [Mastigocoleus testarum]|uniref:Phosphohydrolase n=1 Tax=Mastigocoleus testarum BC008 TaxID=371196 RepID=A0A0V7ZGN3_9CYAN|nr:HD domain-containing protein [Mastigocoleus testarum]KST63656.1 phosphohydrolase [Mastigocoleus testarum BC008]
MEKYQPTLKNWSQEKYIQAYKFAAHAHQGQNIPGSDIPYIMHLSFVSMEAIAALSAEKELSTEKKYDGNLAVQCALLHDTIEDTNITFAEIEAEFGTSVAQGVLALTKDQSIAKHFQMEDSLKRIKQQPPEIWMVKLADRISNLQSPPHYWTKEKKICYREEAISIYETLKDASSFLALRLANKIEDYKAFIL